MFIHHLLDKHIFNSLERIIFPSVPYEAFNSSTSSPALIVFHFDHDHPSGCEVVTYCDFYFLPLFVIDVEHLFMCRLVE